MFGVTIDGATSVFCDNDAVYKNTVLPESTLHKKHHSIAYHRCREAVAAGVIRVAKEGTKSNLSDLFTKNYVFSPTCFLIGKVHVLKQFELTLRYSIMYVHWRSTKGAVINELFGSSLCKI